MRTTLTLDDDLAERLTNLAKESGRPFKTVVNESLRLALDGQATTAIERFDYQAHSGNLRAGIDDRRLNEMPWQLEEERFAR